MDGIIERAESTVIDVKRVAANKIDMRQYGRTFCNKGAAWFAPEPGMWWQRHTVERTFDGAGKAEHRRRFLARIRHGETTADINDVDVDASIRDDAGKLFAVN